MQKENMNQLNEITHCEVCSASKLLPVLNLGLHPMCDDLVRVDDNRTCKEYPIEILYCQICRTAHQRFQVSKEQLFPQTYHYRSKNTQDVLSGMQDLVMTCVQNLGELSGKKILDIGCNDGSLLSYFQEQGSLTFGIEPTGAYLDAEHSGHTVVHDYLTEDTAQAFVNAYGQPDLITFTNVFAHIEDLDQILRAIRILRNDRTCLMIENHYLGAVLKHKQFDTFYHEHPRTYSYGSFVHIAEKMDMFIGLAQFPSRYGGNIRVLLKPRKGNLTDHDKLTVVNETEESFLGDLSVLATEIKKWRESKFSEISKAVNAYGPLVAKAFPGRAAIPIKMLGLNEIMIRAVYEKPQSGKIGHFVPGTRIPIVSDEFLLTDLPLGAPILNLAWHIKDEIEIYMNNKGYQGSFIDII